MPREHNGHLPLCEHDAALCEESRGCDGGGEVELDACVRVLEKYAPLLNLTEHAQHYVRARTA